MTDTVRLVLVSDTHCFHERIALPGGDVLVHAGDFSSSGSPKQARAFAAYFRALPHPHKIVIGGNHDRCLESDPAIAGELFAGCHYLFDSGVTLGGLSFWGSPWQPWFLDWAFNLQRGKPLREKWALIPQGVDVLVTHGPPHGILDRTIGGDPAGCEELRDAMARVKPRLHVFGHIHEGYGWLRSGPTLHVNASSCTFDYDPKNRPIVVDLPLDRSQAAVVVEME